MKGKTKKLILIASWVLVVFGLSMLVVGVVMKVMNLGTESVIYEKDCYFIAEERYIVGLSEGWDRGFHCGQIGRLKCIEEIHNESQTQLKDWKFAYSTHTTSRDCGYIQQDGTDDCSEVKQK